MQRKTLQGDYCREWAEIIKERKKGKFVFWQSLRWMNGWIDGWVDGQLVIVSPAKQKRDIGIAFPALSA